MSAMIFGFLLFLVLGLMSPPDARAEGGGEKYLTVTLEKGQTVSHIAAAYTRNWRNWEKFTLQHPSRDEDYSPDRVNRLPVGTRVLVPMALVKTRGIEVSNRTVEAICREYDERDCVREISAINAIPAGMQFSAATVRIPTDYRLKSKSVVASVRREQAVPSMGASRAPKRAVPVRDELSPRQSELKTPPASPPRAASTPPTVASPPESLSAIPPEVFDTTIASPREQALQYFSSKSKPADFRGGGSATRWRWLFFPILAVVVIGLVVYVIHGVNREGLLKRKHERDGYARYSRPRKAADLPSGSQEENARFVGVPVQFPPDVSDVKAQFMGSFGDKLASLIIARCKIAIRLTSMSVALDQDILQVAFAGEVELVQLQRKVQDVLREVWKDLSPYTQPWRVCSIVLDGGGGQVLIQLCYNGAQACSSSLRFERNAMLAG